MKAPCLPSSLRGVLLASMAAVWLPACHTVHPTTTVDEAIRREVPKLSGRVALVITPEYRDFVSTDRGHLLTDPQTYYIGAALTDLTLEYFRQAFDTVRMVPSLRKAGDEGSFDWIVTPRVVHFDNDVSLLLFKQTFEIELGATVANGAGEIVIEDVTALASGWKRMRFFGGSLQARAGPQLSEVLQAALRDLLIRIGAGLPRAP